MSHTRLHTYLISFILLLSAYSSSAQSERQRWVNETYDKLSREERIGQLFMVAAYSGGKDFNEDKITTLLRNHQIGGLIFMQGGPERQANLTNKFQDMANVPLLLAMDAEWGLGMRLDSVANFPRQMMVGATRDTLLAFQLGTAIGKQCKRLGVHIDFAPVVDVNNNPNNPVINARSFGEDKTRVAAMALAYMHGLQSQGVVACAKHFPGHGDTDADSHKSLPVIKKSLEQLESLEFYPFKELIKGGVKSVMVAHLEVPALETEEHVPTTLSKNTITGQLKNKMGFKGLIFTDAMDMQGVTKYFPAGEADMRAFRAGNDVLLFSQDVPTSIQKINEAIQSGQIPEARLEESVKKILGAKYDAGLAKGQKRVQPEYAVQDLNDMVWTMRSRITRASVTLVADKNKIIEKVAKEKAKIGYVGINAPDNSSELYDDLKAAHSNIEADWMPKGSSAATVTSILNNISKNDATIIAIHKTGIYPLSAGYYGLDEQQMNLLRKAQEKKNVMIVQLGNPYLMGKLCDAKSVLVTYEDDTITESFAAKVILGEKDPTGMLPVSPCASMKAPANGTAPVLAVAKKEPVQHAKKIEKTEFVEDGGVVNPASLDKLNMFIQRSIVDGAFPGCRILASKNGKVFYDESFGYYSSAKGTKVTANTLYDVASVTKVLSTTLAVMRLYENGKLDLNKTVGDYLPWAKGSNKAGLRIKDMLMHQAGLKSWIPFYKETLDADGSLNSSLYKQSSSKKYSIEVAKDLYLRSDYVDTIWDKILASPLDKGRYVYSDLDFYFLAAIVEKITGKSIDKYVEENFYKPMGLKNITYLPLKKYKTSDIAPTENDLTFRHQLIQGYVHDPGAALFGGVAGHAGIFATAQDVAAIFQMLLNKGTYNDARYFKTTTVEQFTKYNSAISRRGLGFDKPSADKEDGGPSSNYCTGATFGHQGFTGTCAWADPGTGVVFVFLSNRVNPSADNNKINRLSVRTIAQDYIYEALGFTKNTGRAEMHRSQTGKKK